MSSERIRIFPQTRDAIGKRIESIEAKLRENTSGLGEMGDDGDSMDDPYMWKLHAEREELESRVRQLRRYLSPDVEVMDRAPSSDEISVGHEIHLIVNYADGEKEELNVTIGSTVDRQYLVENSEYFDENKILISEDSSLAQSLLGRKLGESIEFESLLGIGKARVIDVKPSILLGDTNFD